MSIELPEATILAEQMKKELTGKRVQWVQLKDYEKMQRIGFINKNISAFDLITNGKITYVVSRGNLIIIKLDNGLNLLLGPEYGGKIRHFENQDTIPTKYHLALGFMDKSVLIVALTGMGAIQALKDDELQNSYLYRRDFSKVASPIETDTFTSQRFSQDLENKNVNIKSALVGKEAILVGLSNSAFQDIIYRAKIHPKRKASSLNKNETTALYNAIRLLINERITRGGKDQFTDLHGKRGSYIAAMGPNMKDQTCPICGTKIEKVSLGGGIVFFCPGCQV